MYRRFSEEERQSDIAKAMKLSKVTVSRHTPGGCELATAKPARGSIHHMESENIKHDVAHRPSQEMRKIAVRAVESGEPIVAVSKRCGVNRSTIRIWLNAAVERGEAQRPPRNRMSAEERAELIRRAWSGEEASSIARDLKISKVSAGKIVRKLLRDVEPSSAQKTAVLEERREGQSAAEIAVKLGLPGSIVRASLGTDLTRRYSPELHDAAIKAVSSGESANAVARRLGVRREVINNWFKAAVKRGEALKPLRKTPKMDDFQFTWITRQNSALDDWRRLIVGWFEAKKPGVGTTVKAVTAFIIKYIVALNLPTKPSDLLRRGQLVPDFFQTICSTCQSSREYSRTIYDLIEWVLDSPDFADNDGDEVIRLSNLYRNPINFPLGSKYCVSDRAESSKVVLPYFLISDLRKRIVQGPDFRDWTWVQGLMGRETINGQQLASDWFSVNEDRLDRDDPDCVWRLRPRENLSPVLEMWSPVRWLLHLIHLQTTPRVGQVRMADSGEADTFIWKGEKFIPNPGLLRQGTVRKPHEQGIFRRPSPGDAAMEAKVCLFFNSNKTLDIGKSGKEKGCVCAWPCMENKDEDPYYWLVKLRDWQIKYNPIDRLTQWRDLRGDTKLSPQSQHQLDEYPDTAFLFRTPESPREFGPISAGESAIAWQKLLYAYEGILFKEQIKHPSGEPIELINPKNGRAWSSPHATRVSLITHLILDGNVPVEIMMKIAGHARFIMTVYYTKAGLTRIQNAIKGAAEKLDAIKYETFERDLLNTEGERVRDKIVFNAEDWKTVLPVNPADRNPMGWLHLHDGICLAGGNAENLSSPGCHNGGPILIQATKDRKARHGPVPGGVRNCCRCRWKCAGKHHAPALVATLNNRSYHLHRASASAIAAERERDSLMQDKARVEYAGHPYVRTRELIDAERKYEAAMQIMQQYALDIVALNRMIERLMALPDNTGTPTALAAQGDIVTLNTVIEETDSELLVLAGICADVELFPDLDSGTAIFEFAQLLDQAFEREGQPLILARLSEKEKTVATNAIMRELERHANPNNPIIARRQVVEIMDRGESLEKMLGINFQNILLLAESNGMKPISLRLVNTIEEDNDDSY